MKRFGAAVLMGCPPPVLSSSRLPERQRRSARKGPRRDRRPDVALCPALDTNDAEAYASAYAPDGQFSAGANATRGRDALRKMIADLRQRQVEAQAKGEPKRPPMYHMSANERIQFTDKDHARIEAYYITAIAAGGAAAPLRVVGVGRSIDDVVRLNGQWLITSRNVSPQD